MVDHDVSITRTASNARRLRDVGPRTAHERELEQEIVDLKRENERLKLELEQALGALGAGHGIPGPRFRPMG